METSGKHKSFKMLLFAAILGMLVTFTLGFVAGWLVNNQELIKEKRHTQNNLALLDKLNDALDYHRRINNKILESFACDKRQDYDCAKSAFTEAEHLTSEVNRVEDNIVKLLETAIRTGSR